MNPLEGRIIELPKITDPRGNLTVAESFKNVPFDIKRAYWLYDVPGGESFPVFLIPRIERRTHVGKYQNQRAKKRFYKNH